MFEFVSNFSDFDLIGGIAVAPKFQQSGFGFARKDSKSTVGNFGFFIRLVIGEERWSPNIKILDRAGQEQMGHSGMGVVTVKVSTSFSICVSGACQSFLKQVSRH